MTFSLVLFIAIAVMLVLLLAWAARASRQTLLAPEDVFRLLSEERHYARLPQILQSLQKEDTEYLRDRGHEALWNRIRTERKRIAIRYLDYLEQEYQVLLEASRITARLAPQLSTIHEADRLAKNLKFALCCRHLRWRLRFGMEPWNVFNTISDMTGSMTLQLEAAITRLGENAATSGDANSSSNDRGGRSF
jgi:hypothetical protein